MNHLHSDDVMVTLWHPQFTLTVSPSTIERITTHGGADGLSFRFALPINDPSMESLSDLVGDDSVAMMLDAGNIKIWHGFVWIVNFRRLPRFPTATLDKIEVQLLSHHEYAFPDWVASRPT